MATSKVLEFNQLHIHVKTNRSDTFTYITHANPRSSQTLTREREIQKQRAKLTQIFI